MDNHDKQYDRRKVMKVLVIGGVATAVALPGKWTKPLINAVIVPAHAAASAPPTTVPPTSTTATTPPPTTTTATTPPPTTSAP
ncbi:MAG: hypothetical protein H6876_01460 [Hyphomicrobiaceae bacterium]|nr:hypothetical protein [Hyphomicrobiaceae bacterium]MCC0006779.1 hypothetical protein [Hyphomicrobiaceae bacterium]